MLSDSCVKVFIYLGFLWKLFRICCGGDVGMPLIQISHDEDDFPDVPEQVHLADFFWTGSGDGPPDFLKKVHTGINRGKDVVVKTETVVATIYADGNNEVDIPICLECYGDAVLGLDTGWHFAGSGLPFNFSRADRRYWLLTVLSGFYTQENNPLLAAKLAKLYRLAFTRQQTHEQQTRHLGINGGQHITDNSLAPNTKDKRHEIKELTTTKSDALDDEFEEFDVPTNLVPEKNNFNYEWFSSSEEMSPENFLNLTEGYVSNEGEMENTSSTFYPAITSQLWEFIQKPMQSGKQEQLPPNALILRDDQVHVIIYNITRLTKNDVQRIANSESSNGDINDKIDERPIANQTELIYSVFVNGHPVLATTAANDMKLVSETEVSTVLGKDIYMKAEPYMREPQATPLAPATHSSTTLFSSLQNNPAMIIISAVAIFLLLLLLVTLLLIARAHVRQRSGTRERASSRNELLSEPPSGTAISSIMALESGRSTVQSRDVGTQNFSFENDSCRTTIVRKPRIHFPGPPPIRSSERRHSTTSSNSTSDSSIYCPINPTNGDVQDILDEKAAKLFGCYETRKRHQYDQAAVQNEEATYTTIISEKRESDKSRNKSKRKYLSENRVGSLETSPVQSQKEWSGDEASKSLASKHIYENYDRSKKKSKIHNNYNHNKILHQGAIFSDKVFTGSQKVTTPEVVSNAKHMHCSNEKLSDNSSIGSFLSMQSIKAFPKQDLPEPLSHVLDPVSVTYYDNIENAGQRSRRCEEFEEIFVENFPTPKKPQKYKRFNSQSDNPDPGVLGPIVWERHKKHCSTDNLLGNDDITFAHLPTKTQDPATLRHHYEDLLEDAIYKYVSHEDLHTPLPHKDFMNMRKPYKLELRGSSAEKPNSNIKNFKYENRPATAHATKAPRSNHSTQPPSPTFGAWNSDSACGYHSRPMSAETFNRPTDLYPNLISRPTINVTSAPLIEAIQIELRKFQKQCK